DCMPNRGWFSRSLGGLTVVGLAWACQDASRLVTPPRVPTMRPSFDASSPPGLQPGVLQVCKDTPTGTSGTFNIAINFHLPDGTNPSQANFINSGACLFIGTATVAESPVVNDIFEEPAGFPGTTAGFNLVSVTRITTTGGTEQLS